MKFALNGAITSILVILLISNTTFSQSTSETETHPHDFDFWIGTWDVYKYGTDTMVGLSEIRPILYHRAIEENYQGYQNPYRGTSNNIYNATKQRWEQYWVDNSGLALHITGGLEDGKMVLKNCEEQNCNKIVWTPHQDKTVRQEWLISADGGATWNKVFDGHYLPKKNSSSVKPLLTHLNEYPNVRDFTISPDGKEAYLTVQSPTEDRRTICRITKNYGIWSQPTPASFSGQYKDLEPYFSNNGLRLYFASNRPNDFEKENYDIYYVERAHQDSTWSEAINIGSPVNTAADEFYPAIANSGNIYFTCVKEKDNGKDDIYFSEKSEEGFSEPQSLDTTINTRGYEFNSYIAPDESYIIFGGYLRADGYGSGDLYISFKNEDGSWTKAKNLGSEINSAALDFCPFVDAEGNLYFTSRRSNPSDAVIRNNFELEREILKYENGASRVYTVPLQDLLKN